MSEEFIGNYRVVDMVGQGGMGKVYLAVHKDIPNLRVILKILSDPRLADRFKQEADKLALLDGHANICQIKHFFNHGDDLVIAMEYIDGETLDDKLREAGRIPLAEAAHIVCDMLAILSYAHERGVSHRDIKPSNVMIDKSEQVKIIDFGIAKSKSDPNLTMTGASLGTPAYMAPEQYIPNDDTNYDLADVYACGITLFQMTTGELPFKTDNEFLMRDAKLTTDPPKPRSLNAGISKPMEAIILKAIDKDPTKRFQTADEMRRALRQECREDEVRGSQPTESIPRTPIPSPTGRRKPVARYGIIGGAVVVAVALIYWLFGRGPVAPDAPALLQPPQGAQFTVADSIAFQWEPTAGSGGRYMIEYAADSLFEGMKKILSMQGSFMFPPGLAPGTYYWRIIPATSDGLRGTKSERWSFVITATTELQGRITIAVDPRGDIYINDSLLGRNTVTASASLDTGTYPIRIENRQSREKVIRDEVTLAGGDDITREFSFTFNTAPSSGTAESKPAAPAKQGEVRVGSKPRGAKIYVDGALQPVQTNNTVWLAPGRHIISVSLVLDGVEQVQVDTVQVTVDGVHKSLFEFEQ